MTDTYIHGGAHVTKYRKGSKLIFYKNKKCSRVAENQIIGETKMYPQGVC